MSERTIDAVPTAERSTAVKQLEHSLSSTPRTLWGDAWRRFLRHKLALLGSAMLLFFIVAVVIGPLIDRSYKSQQGHIVVRVLPGGKNYYVIILDDSTADMPVKNIFPK